MTRSEAYPGHPAGIGEGVAFDPSVLRLGGDLRRRGVEPLSSQWHRVRRGIFVPETDWARMSPTHRHAAFVHGAALCSEHGRMVFARTASAAVHGLPRVSAWPEIVPILVDAGRPVDREKLVEADDMAVPPRAKTRARGSGPVLRRVAGMCENPVVLNGVAVTPVARTIVDLARYDSLENAMAAADFALRLAMCTTEDLMAEVAVIPKHGHGRPAARLVADLADSRSGSVGESLSRVQLFRLNLPRPVLQQEFRDERGRIGYTDFAWPGLVGEFDGRMKYRTEFAADPEQVQDILWREKQREDRLRRQVDVARWTWAVALDTVKLGKLLAAHGLRPLARSDWLR
jgi:hypothetical protein